MTSQTIPASIPALPPLSPCAFAWAVQEAVLQLQVPKSSRCDHWKVVVLLGTPDQRAEALARISTALAEGDGEHLDLQTLAYDGHSAQRALHFPRNLVTLWTGNPALEAGKLTAEKRRMAVNHLALCGQDHQRAVVLGTQLDFRLLSQEKITWLDGRALLLPLWCGTLDEARAALRAVRGFNPGQPTGLLATS